MLRREFAALKPAHVPDAPTHASLVAARDRQHHRRGGRLMTHRRTLAVVSAGLSVAVVDPAAGRPARRRHRDGPARPRDRRPRSRSSSCASTPATWPTTWSPASRTPSCDRRSTPSPAPTALIAVTPIFAASYSGLFKTFFDVLEEDALAGKPVLLGATAGTARHSLALDHALRPLFAYLRAVAVPTGVFAAADDWGRRRRQRASRTRIDRAGGELADLVAGRAPTAPRPTRSPTSCRSRPCSAAADESPFLRRRVSVLRTASLRSQDGESPFSTVTRRFQNVVRAAPAA